jgi:hypothetical protein
MPLSQGEVGEDVLPMLTEAVRQSLAASLETVEAQRQRFAKIGTVGRRDG